MSTVRSSSSLAETAPSNGAGAGELTESVCEPRHSNDTRKKATTPCTAQKAKEAPSETRVDRVSPRRNRLRNNDDTEPRTSGNNDSNVVGRERDVTPKDGTFEDVDVPDNDPTNENGDGPDDLSVTASSTHTPSARTARTATNRVRSKTTRSRRRSTDVSRIDRSKSFRVWLSKPPKSLAVPAPVQAEHRRSFLAPSRWKRPTSSSVTVTTVVVGITVAQLIYRLLTAMTLTVSFASTPTHYDYLMASALVVGGGLTTATAVGALAILWGRATYLAGAVSAGLFLILVPPLVYGVNGLKLSAVFSSPGGNIGAVLGLVTMFSIFLFIVVLTDVVLLQRRSRTPFGTARRR